jgi:hypothetical protein
MGHWKLIRGEEGDVTTLMLVGRIEGDDTQKCPASWFLCGAIRFTDAEKLKYGNFWEEAQGGKLFSDRNSME